MRESDQQLGKPMRAYRDTKANIVGLGLGAADEGCMAYANDVDDFGTFDGANWTWLAAPPAVAGYALVSDGVDTWAADQTPAWTGEHSFAAGIAFTGASGVNEITVPDDTAIALELLDAGGLEYMRVVSTDANPYFLIDPAGAGIKAGIGLALPDGTLHVHTATAGAVAASATGDDLVVENSASGGISILVPDAAQANLFFGSPSDNVGAMIRWVFDDLLFTFGTAQPGGEVSIVSGNVAEAIRIDSAQKVGIGAAPTYLLEANGTIASYQTTTVRYTECGLRLRTKSAAVSNLTHKPSPYAEWMGSIWTGAAAADRIIMAQLQGISGQDSQYYLEFGSSSVANIICIRGDTGYTGFGTKTPTGVVDIVVPDLISGGATAWHLSNAADANQLRMGISAANNYAWIEAVETGVGFNTNLTIQGQGGNLGIGLLAGIAGKVHIDQPSTTATIPVLVLDQADLSEEFINLITTVGAGNPVQTGALGTYYGKMRVAVNGAFKYIGLYNS